VKYDDAEPRHAHLPDDYLAAAAKGGPPMLFLTGEHNRVFGDSVVQEHEAMSRETADPDRYELFVAPGYGYVDTIIGRDAHRDVFPHLLDFLHRRAV
jgi:hypothetical protein